VELFFEFLYGVNRPVSSLFVLARLDEIVTTVPGLKEAAGGIPSLGRAP
jgi:hypothetical protein